MDSVIHFFTSHHYLAVIVGVWIAAATLVNAKIWPKTPNMPTWQKVLHAIFVDVPSCLAAPGYRGFLGRLGVPFLSWSFGDGKDPNAKN